MDIKTGLYDCIVLQRNRRNVTEACVTGVAAAAGTVLATVKRGNRTLSGWAQKTLGKTKAKRFSVTLNGIPVGGPYAITLSVVDKAGAVLDECTVQDVLVGDVWLLAGQSNMQGCGLLSEGATPQDDVRAFYMDDVWAPAKDPIHQLYKAVDPAHAVISGGPIAKPPVIKTGTGPGVSFAQSMRAFTGVPQGVIPCAHGGTTISQWDPKRMPKEGNACLYGAMIRRLQANGGKVAGLFWYQGCSDATPEAAPLYYERMKAFLKAVRRDTKNPKLPFVQVQISRVYGHGWNHAAWNGIQDVQRRLQETEVNVATVPAIDLDFNDAIHISGASQQRLGKRGAQAMQALVYGRKGGKLPILPGRVEIKTNPVSGLADVVVHLQNVEGKLVSADRPHGFSFVRNGHDGRLVRSVVLAGSKVILHTCTSVADIGNYCLHYGFDTDNYCNITDSADRSVPVFGPMPVAPRRALTPFATTVQVSGIEPLAKTVKTLKCPSSAVRNKWTKRSFPTEFCDMHEEIGKNKKNGVMYFAARFRCAQNMALALNLGYDGPVKAWVDGRAVFVQESASNPAKMDEGVAKFRAEKGEHDVVIALDTRKGASWGVFVRLERLGVKRETLEKRFETVVLPQWV